MRRISTPTTLLAATLALASAGGCNTGKGSVGGEVADTGDGGAGATVADARFITDVYSWECIDRDTGGESNYQGIFAQVVTLEHAPGAVSPLSLPAPGDCVLGLDMFPAGAGAGAADLPDASARPRWESDDDDGELQQRSTGFWRADVFENEHSCQDVEDVLGEGTRLADASTLTGISTPSPVEIPVVSFSGLTHHEETGAKTIEWGDEVTAEWGSHAWDEVWVQVRREREGEAWESVTCNATGLSSFTLDASAWGLMDPDLQVEQNQLYVGFQREDAQGTAVGGAAITLTRAMAVAIVQD